MRGWGLVLVVAIVLAGCRDLPPDVNRMPPPPALPPMSSISLPKTAGPWTRPVKVNAVGWAEGLLI